MKAALVVPLTVTMIACGGTDPTSRQQPSVAGSELTASIGPPIDSARVQIFEEDVQGSGTFDDCGDFLIKYYETLRIKDIVHLDAAGSLEWVGSQAKALESTLCNSNYPDVCISTGPGELRVEKSRFDASGIRIWYALTGPGWKITLPGSGLIFIENGRTECQRIAYPWEPPPRWACNYVGPDNHRDFGTDLAAICSALTP